MSDQKNKQQQPQKGDEMHKDKTREPQGSQQPGKQPGDQKSGKQPGDQSGSQNSGSKQAGQPQGSQQHGNQPQGSQQQGAHKGNMADTRKEQPMGGDIENPDMDNDPKKELKIDDDPEQTKKKVPNMHK
jgi:hypothetical protein